MVSRTAYHEGLTASELRRRLAKAGCTFEDRKKHTRVFYQGNESHIPRHPSKEIKKGTLQGILKQLDIQNV
jgi:mRNA interferase HicA